MKRLKSKIVVMNEYKGCIRFINRALHPIVVCVVSGSIFLTSSMVSAKSSQRPKNKSNPSVYTCPSVSVEEEFYFPNSDDIKNTKTKLDFTTNALRKKFRELRNKGKKVHARVMRNLALKRKKHFIKIMRSAPDAAMLRMLPKNEREEIGTFTTNCVETPKVVEGKLEIIVSDSFRTKESKTEYLLETKKYGRINLHPAYGVNKSIKSGIEVRVRGLLLDNDLLFDGRYSLEEASSELGGIQIVSMAGAGSAVLGDYKQMVILVNFQNTALDPGISVNTTADIMDDVRGYYEEISYNQAWVSGVDNPSRGADVFGIYGLAEDASCDFDHTIDLAKNEVISEFPGIDFNDYDKFMVVAAFPCAWGGKANVGGVNAAVNGFLTFGMGTVAHELGHNFGNNHALALDCAEESINYPLACDVIGYGDSFDVMGGSSWKGHFNAPHKENMGWFNQPGKPMIEEIIGPGLHQRTISPIEISDNSLQALKIARLSNDYLYIEFRQPNGYDDRFTNLFDGDVYDGALLHTLAGIGTSGTYLVDATPTVPKSTQEPSLHDEDTFIDPARGHSVTVTDVTPAGLTVEINMIDFETNNPTISNFFPPDGAEVSGLMTMSVEAVDDTSIGRVEFELIDYINPNMKNIETVAVSGDTFETTIDTALMHNEYWLVVVTAYDQFNNKSNQIFSYIWVENSGDDVDPMVQLIEPQPGAETVSQFVTIELAATDSETGIWKVEFYENYYTENPAFTEAVNISPIEIEHQFSFTGPYVLMARAYDFQGNTAETEWVAFDVVDNVDITRPKVRFSGALELDGSQEFVTVSGIVPISVNATDNVGVTQVTLQLHEGFQDPSPVELAVIMSPSFEYDWDSSTVSDGSYLVQAEASDVAGNVSFVDIDIEVNNSDTDGDIDGDRVQDDQDNCPDHSNPGQEDTDGDNTGNACEFYAELISPWPDGSTLPAVSTAFEWTAGIQTELMTVMGTQYVFMIGTEIQGYDIYAPGFFGATDATIADVDLTGLPAGTQIFVTLISRRAVNQGLKYMHYDFIISAP